MGAFFDGELMCGGDWASVQVEVLPNSGYDVVAQCANGTAVSMECDYDIDGGIVAVRANGASGAVRCPEPDPTFGNALAPAGNLALSGNVAAGACACTETVTYASSNPMTHTATAKFYELPVGQ